MIVKVFFHGRPVSKSRCTDGPGGKPCEVCREASAKTRRRWRKARAEAIARDPSLQPHGVMNTYQLWGCRCDECRAAGTTTRYKYAYRGTDGTLRRMDNKRGHAEPFGREWLNE